MNRAFLERKEFTDQGTMGAFYFERLKFFSGELPWHDNEAEISCIPSGVYECVWNWSHQLSRFGYELLDVPNRTGIRIHPANLMGDKDKGFKSEVLGCIALGEKIGFLDGQRAVMLSQRAVQRFEDYLAGESFILEIS